MYSIHGKMNLFLRYGVGHTIYAYHYYFKIIWFFFFFSHFSIVNLFNPHQFDIKVHFKWIFDTNAYINASKCMNSTLYRVNCFEWILRLKLKHKIEEKKNVWIENNLWVCYTYGFTLKIAWIEYISILAGISISLF